MSPAEVLQLVKPHIGHYRKFFQPLRARIKNVDAASKRRQHRNQGLRHMTRTENRDVPGFLSGEPFEKLAGVLELAGEWTRAAGLEQGGEQWAEAWSALETLRGEAEGLDMDPRHALARAITASPA